MAISKQSKIFDLDGQQVVFDFIRFQDAISNLAKRRKKTKHTIYLEISCAACVSEEAVRNWARRANGPSDLSMIIAAAKTLEISNWKDLLTNFEEEQTMKLILTDRQQEAAKCIYNAVIDFLDEFSESNGFNDIWFELTCNPADREDELCNIVEAKHRDVYRVCKREYFDLHNTRIYEELCDFVYNDLFEIFNGKLSYGYRFEAMVDNHPTTEDDYSDALKKINAIICKYL